MDTITGTAAGVPFTALAPASGTDEPAPLVVTWHMLDAPRTDAAFAAALPMTGVPAWRVHLGMPMCGARMVDGRLDAAVALAAEDALLAFLLPLVHQAADEFPAALAALRERFPVDDGPVHLLGASLGGAVALQVVTTSSAPVGSAALVNPAVRIRSVVPLLDGLAGHPYTWTPEAERAADDHDLVTRASTTTTPLLVVSGELDHPDLREDAADLARRGHDVDLVTVPGLAHPLADEPGLEPAPQSAAAAAVDEILTSWFAGRLRRRTGGPRANG